MALGTRKTASRWRLMLSSTLCCAFPENGKNAPNHGARPRRPVPDQLAEHAELPSGRFRSCVTFDGSSVPQYAELPLQAVSTPRHWPRGIQRQDIQLPWVGHDASEKSRGDFKWAIQDGQHFVTCARSGEAMPFMSIVETRRPPLAGRVEAELPSSPEAFPSWL